MTIPGVVKEFGTSAELERVELIEIKEIITKKKDTDQSLIETAKHFQQPIISEDKKMLKQAKRSSLPFFNTLMIMNFLIYKKVINQADYIAALDLLQDEAYYNAFIFEYGKMVYERITEKNRKD
ncbi:MAG: hypothetical protein HF978_13980 [Desulfobacteraceae bacterium]|nr:hypothetical protein [Desulfobacteraceae bacterium]MBC2756648.1 hypothetical protein [Desulfobacteraceae bacterium]